MLHGRLIIQDYGKHISIQHISSIIEEPQDPSFHTCPASCVDFQKLAFNSGGSLLAFKHTKKHPVYMQKLYVFLISKVIAMRI